MATVGLRVISGNSNVELAKTICDHLGIWLCRAKIDRFSDGEILVEVGESVRGTDAFVIQSLAHPVNDHLMELLAIVDALKRSSVRRITAVMPYYGYARQDRKSKPRVPITARLEHVIVFVHVDAEDIPVIDPIRTETPGTAEEIRMEDLLGSGYPTSG